MKTKFICFSVVAVILISALTAITAQEGMPPMGAPDEIKALNWLVGEWDIDAEFQMDPTQGWLKSKATAVYKYSVDGCALEMDYYSNMMGMTFVGKLIETYDRPNKQYQTIWIDNMAGRMSYYTGNVVGDSTILIGTEIMPDGTEVIARVLTYNEKESSFDWHIDMSHDGGKTFMVSGKAKYTKKK